MRHVILTCKNHRDLRWSCKEIACSATPLPGAPAQYNGTRNLSFCGTPSGKGMYHDYSGLDCTTFIEGEGIFKECDCPASELIFADEDAWVKRV